MQRTFAQEIGLDLDRFRSNQSAPMSGGIHRVVRVQVRGSSNHFQLRRRILQFAEAALGHRLPVDSAA